MHIKLIATRKLVGVWCRCR